jgi:uncharacterized protein (DUF924 family)
MPRSDRASGRCAIWCWDRARPAGATIRRPCWRQSSCSTEAFAADPLALQLALEAIGKGWDAGMSNDRRQFVYLPLEHAEDAAMQALSVEKFASLGDDYVLDFARKHAEVIARFGRFPSRNAALGRDSTPEELAFLSEEGTGW